MRHLRAISDGGTFRDDIDILIFRLRIDAADFFNDNIPESALKIAVERGSSGHRAVFIADGDSFVIIIVREFRAAAAITNCIALESDNRSDIIVALRADLVDDLRSAEHEVVVDITDEGITDHAARIAVTRRGSSRRDRTDRGICNSTMVHHAGFGVTDDATSVVRTVK